MNHKTEQLEPRHPATKARRHEGNTFAQSSSPPCLSPAFTLTEILVVIVIIVLMLAMAMPLFHTLTTSRSEASASNQIASMLARARSEAIGLQIPRGVAFYTDAASGRTAMALVESKAATAGTWVNGLLLVPPTGPPGPFARGTYVHDAAGALWVAVNDIPNGVTIAPSTANPNWSPADTNVIDQTPDSDAELLPGGVGVQLINDWGLASAGSTTPTSDAYVSTSAIMFDSQGRLSSIPISITAGGIIGQAMNMSPTPTTGSHNYPTWGATSNSTTPPVSPTPLYGSATHTLYSSFGIVLFQQDAFQSQTFDTLDPTYSPNVGTKAGSYTTGSPSEKTEETWLDQNATPLLINRFNGTLIKGE